MNSFITILKGEIGHMIGFFTLVGMAMAFVATKAEVIAVNSNVNMLRMELTIRVNENKLASLDKVEEKTPELLREIAALEASNQRLESKMEDSINADM